MHAKFQTQQNKTKQTKKPHVHVFHYLEKLAVDSQILSKIYCGKSTSQNF